MCIRDSPNLIHLHGSLDTPDSASQTKSRSVQPFLHSSMQKVHNLMGRSFPVPIAPPHWGSEIPANTGYGSLDPPKSTSQTTCGSVQRFLQGGSSSRYMTVVKFSFSSAIVTANAVNNDETVATYRSARTGQCTLRHTDSCQLDIQHSDHDTRRHSCSRRRGISSELHSHRTADSAAWIRKGYKVPVRIQCKVNRTIV